MHAQSSSGDRVTAVIVHYKTPEETVAAAAALAQTAPGAEILVIDNASDDRVAADLAERVPRVRLIHETANRGYGAACNRGARESARPYLLFLNSDALVDAGSVAALEAALDRDLQASAAGPRLRHPDGSLQRSIRRLPTPWRIFCESSGLAFLFGGREPFAGHSATRQDHETPRPVEALMGAVLLVRRTAFEQAGGFDEGFFLYAEETDLMKRWRSLGWRLLYEPRAGAVHAGGRSGGDRLFGQLHASLERYVRKHHGPGSARRVRAVLRMGALLRYAAALATPGEAGRRRRARYRAALSGEAR